MSHLSELHIYFGYPENPLVKSVVEKSPAVEALKNNPLFKAAQMAKRVSPGILTAAAPAPPPVEAPPPIEVPSSSESSDLEVIVEEEAKPSS